MPPSSLRQKLAIVVAVTACSGTARAQLLEHASEVVRADDSPSSSSGSSDSDDDDDDEPEYAYEPSGSAGPWEDSVDPSELPGLPSSPYPYGDWAEDGREPTGLLQMDVEGGYVFGGAARVGAGIRAEGPYRLDLDARLSMFGEPRADGFDAVGLLRAGIGLRIVDLPRAQVRLGLGGRLFGDAAGPVLGADASLGLDILPVKPFMLVIEAQTGFVGAAWLAQLRGSIAIVRGSWSVYVGYEHVVLASSGGIAELGGPMIGLAFWR